MKLMIMITNRHKSDAIIKEISMNDHMLKSITFIGHGTATSEILDALNLEASDKDVVLAIVEDNHVQPIFEILEEKFQFSRKGKGVALTVALNGISAQTFKLLTEVKGEEI